MCDEFFLSLPKLLEDSDIHEPAYEKMLYATLELEGYDQIKKINEYIGFEEFGWEDEKSLLKDCVATTPGARSSWDVVLAWGQKPIVLFTCG